MAKVEPVRKRKGMTLRMRATLAGLLFTAPWLVGITVFFLANIGQALWYSLNLVEIDRDAGGLMYTWVGMDNFHHVFREHGSFFREMFESVLQLIINVPLIIFFSLFMAIILNRKFVGRGMVRAIFFLPVILGSAAIANTIETSVALLHGGVSGLPPDVLREAQGFNAGAIIALLNTFQMPQQVVELVTDTIANLHGVIRSAGVQILIFLAALQSIPPSMYEVAQIEGATGYEIFWKITIPMVSPLILTNIVYTVVDTYANSDVVSTANDVFFYEQRFGVSAAMSVSSAALVCLTLFAICWVISRYVFYYD